MSEDMEALCFVRTIYQSIGEYEHRFAQAHQLCLNEGMILCLLQSGSLSSSSIAVQLGLSASNTSKVIKVVEEKGLINRKLGEQDKRQMYFSLSEEGKNKLADIQATDIELPPLLQNIIDFTKEKQNNK